ncbi:hypothetical protein PROFUN_05141 [Planoprotostelium fungivorum]|uniref:Glutathione S-transferase C-terminal domain-containing protein n=1 Tax=Planoprotostelium fungivorum TaxID=1890364 RepID=A0A2P6NRQ3_9EUKA|nr:hypothetical protein PROFUN_05141 [Planoprotostelium fungivorum]
MGIWGQGGSLRETVAAAIEFFLMNDHVINCGSTFRWRRRQRRVQEDAVVDSSFLSYLCENLSASISHTQQHRYLWNKRNSRPISKSGCDRHPTQAVRIFEAERIFTSLIFFIRPGQVGVGSRAAVRDRNISPGGRNSETNGMSKPKGEEGLFKKYVYRSESSKLDGFQEPSTNARFSEMVNYTKPAFNADGRSTVGPTWRQGRYDHLVTEVLTETISSLVKKHWEKRWLCFNDDFIYIYRSKTTDYPLAVIPRLGGNVISEVIFDDKAKKRYFVKIAAPSTYVEREELKKLNHFIGFEDREDFLQFSSPLINHTEAYHTEEDSEISQESVPTISDTPKMGRANPSTTLLSVAQMAPPTNRPPSQHFAHPPKFSTLFYNPMVPSSLAVSLFALEHNLPIERNSVHISWLAETYAKGTQTQEKKSGNQPLFIRISPQCKVPAYFSDQDPENYQFDGAEILKGMVSRFKLDETLYPEEKVKRKRVDELMSYGLGRSIMEAQQPMFAKIIDTTSKSGYSSSNMLKEVQRIVTRLDSELKSSRFLTGDHLTIADVLLICEVNASQSVGIDITKFGALANLTSRSLCVAYAFSSNFHLTLLSPREMIFRGFICGGAKYERDLALTGPNSVSQSLSRTCLGMTLGHQPFHQRSSSSNTTMSLTLPSINTMVCRFFDATENLLSFRDPLTLRLTLPPIGQLPHSPPRVTSPVYQPTSPVQQTDLAFPSHVIWCRPIVVEGLGSTTSTPLPVKKVQKARCNSCEMCREGISFFLCKTDPDTNSRSPGRKEMALAILSYLHVTKGQEWYSLRDDIYPILESHLHLYPDNASERSPHRQLHDTMAHNKKHFQSGKGTTRRNGLWQLSAKYRKYLELNHTMEKKRITESR